MNHAKSPSVSEDLFDTMPHQKLRLRVRNAPGAQVVSVTEPRFTIGSAETCQLRLDDAAPVECLLIVGDAGTIVRRWQGRGQLNGHFIDDAWLNPGDELTLTNGHQIVVESDQAETDSTQHPEATSPDSLPKPSFVDTSNSRTVRSLARRRIQQLVSSIRCERERVQSLTNRVAELETEIDSVRSQADAAQNDLQARNEQINDLTAELSNASNLADDLRIQIDELNAQVIQHDSSHNEFVESWIARANDLLQASGVPEAEWLSNEAPQDAADRFYARMLAVLQRRSEEQSSTDHAELIAELESAQTEVDRRSQEIEVHFQQIEQQLIELQKLREELEHDRDALDASRQKLEADRAAFESQVESIESIVAERDLLKQQLAASEESTGEDTTPLADLLDIVVPESSFGIPPETHEHGEPAHGDVPDDGDTLSGSGEETEFDYRDVEQNGSNNTDSTMVLSDLSAADFSDEALDAELQVETEETEEIEFCEPTDAPPIDTASILAKYGVETEPDENEEATGPSDVSMTMPVDDISAVQSMPDVAPPGDHGEGDSIEAYMAQLLNRVGGKSTQDIVVPVAKPEANEREQPPKANEFERAEATPLRPEEFVPRSKQPELDISSMRSIANESARAAISRHLQKKTRKAAATQWFIAACLVVSGGILWFWPGGHKVLAKSGAGLSFVIAVYMALRAMGLCRSTRSMGQKLNGITEKKQKRQRAKGKQKLKEAAEAAAQTPPNDPAPKL